MKKLENIRLKELNAHEQKNTNGGAFPWVAVILFVGSMINDAQNNPDDFWEGYYAVTE